MSQRPPSVSEDEASRILLVDGDATSVDLWRRTLESRGFAFLVAPSGEDGLKIARLARPLLILLDLALPGIDGFETCRRLKEDPESRDAAVIFLSSVDQAKDRVRGFEAGAVDFITRPFQEDEVVARISTHLDLQRRLRRPPEAPGVATRVALPADPAIPRPHGGPPPPSDAEAGLESLALVSDAGPRGPVFRAGDVAAARFRIVRYLAQGAMGELYEAEDLELKERVALKTILSSVAGDERSILLFKREVQLARQVTHPNVCRMYDVFRHQSGAADGRDGAGGEVVFLAMELLHGETLAERLRRAKRIPTAEALPLVRQMAAGLAAAHRAGVVHRDFKSHNVMLEEPTPSREGMRVVITDFGLARRSADDRGHVSAALSQDGAMSGSPAYMAPEQVEGGAITPAADVYALGVVLYEMVTGVWPFLGESALQIAVKRLQEAPPSPRVYVPDLDPRWEATILRCLARRPADRFATVEEVQAALEGEAPPAAPAPRPRRRRRLVAALAGISILAAAIGGGLVRARRTRLPAAAHTVVLADFSNSTGDPAFDDTLQQVLATGLQQSPLLEIVPDRTVRDTLKLMGRAPEERLTADVAQELCLRAASRAVIEGTISTLGSQYVVGLNAVNCQTGDSLDRETVPAAKKEDVLAALEQATKRLRGRVGESLSTQKAETLIAQATTSSLEALQSYTRGVRANGQQGAMAAIPFYERAIDLDGSFAMAYASLGNAYVDLREHDRANLSFQKAFELRDQVSERERFALDAYYYANVTGELEKARRIHELWTQAYPSSSTPHTNLAVIHSARGEYEKALAETLESLRLYPDSGAASTFLAANYCRLGRLEEAKAAYERALARHGDRPALHFIRYGIAFLDGDEAEMERQVAWGTGNPEAEDLLLSYQADTEASAGRLGRARELSHRAVEAARRTDKKEAAAREQLGSALREAELGNTAEARRETAAALALAPCASVRLLAAFVLARAGDSDQALRMADELEKQNPGHAKINEYWLPTLRASVELRRDNPSKAVEILEAAAPHELGVSDPQPEVGALHPVYVRGLAYLALKQGTAAAGEFQKFLDHRGVVVNGPLGTLAHLGLARAHVLEGDTARARDAYTRFFVLCRDADADVPILRQARAELARVAP